MAPWLQSALVYGLVAASLAFGLLRLFVAQHSTRIRQPLSFAVGPGLALAAPFALEYGGRGALVWAIAGLVLVALLRRALPASQFPQTPDRISRLSTLLHTLAQLTLMVICASLLGQQGQSVLIDLFPDRRIWSGVLQGLLLAPLALVLLLPARTATRIRPPFAWAVSLGWILACLFAIAGQASALPTSLQASVAACFDALKFDEATHQENQRHLAAFLAMASAGIVAAIWAQAPQAPHPKTATGSKVRDWMSLLLNVVAVTVTGALLLISKAPLEQRLDDPNIRPSQRDDSTKSFPPANAKRFAGLSQAQPAQPPRWLPLERPHARSFAATSLGQSIVLPKDSPLLRDLEYTLLFRGNPRGSRLGKLTPRGNGIFIPYPWRSLHNIEYIRFRDKNPKRNKSGAWDLRVPVDVRMLGSERTPRGVVLVPKNPALVLTEMSETLDGPYIELEDQVVIASPQRMHNSTYGVHDALLGHESHPQNEFSPTLRDLVGQLGFRGPYLNAQAQMRPPFAMIAHEGFDGRNQSQRELVFKTPARGLDVGFLGHDGSLVTPPWEHLTRSRALIFRHQTSPHLDLVIPAKYRFESGRLHFYPDSPLFNSLRELSRNKNYSGPFLAAPDYHFTVEIHGGENFPDLPGTPLEERGLQTGALAKRASLVPLHPWSEPAGAQTTLYRPHPAEFSTTDAMGPFLPSDPSQWLLRAFAQSSPFLRSVARLLLLALFASGALERCRRCTQMLEDLLGPSGRFVAPWVLLACAAIGTLATWSTLAHALMLGACAVLGTQVFQGLTTLVTSRSRQR